MKIYHYFVSDPATERKLDQILEALVQLTRGSKYMRETIDRLIAETAKITNVTDSVLNVVNRLSQEVRDAAANAVSPEDKAMLNKLADDLSASASKITDAVTANTPAAPT